MLPVVEQASLPPSSPPYFDQLIVPDALEIATLTASERVRTSIQKAAKLVESGDFRAAHRILEAEHQKTSRAAEIFKVPFLYLEKDEFHYLTLSLAKVEGLLKKYEKVDSLVLNILRDSPSDRVRFSTVMTWTQFALESGSPGEARDRIHGFVLDRADRLLTDHAYAKALSTHAHSLIETRDYVAAKDSAEASIAYHREHGDLVGQLEALSVYSQSLECLGFDKRAWRVLVDAVVLAQNLPHDERKYLAYALEEQGVFTLARGFFYPALKSFEECNIEWREHLPTNSIEYLRILVRLALTEMIFGKEKRASIHIVQADALQTRLKLSVDEALIMLEDAELWFKDNKIPSGAESALALQNIVKVRRTSRA